MYIIRFHFRMFLSFLCSEIVVFFRAKQTKAWTKVAEPCHCICYIAGAGHTQPNRRGEPSESDYLLNFFLYGSLSHTCEIP